MNKKEICGKIIFLIFKSSKKKELIIILQSMLDTSQSSLSLWLNCRPEIQHRINALLNYQAEYFRLRAQFHRQIQQLQYEFSSQFEPILDKQRTIISTRSISEFWLTILKNLDSYDYPIRSRDELCLKYLIDIRCIHEPLGFKLEFHFSPLNPFFTETILTKTYSIRIEFNETNPYQVYDGPEIDRCQGCSINWREDSNLTYEKRRRQPRKSFFDFFSPPIIPAGGIPSMTEDEQLRLEADIEFSLLLKQRVLPRAVLYYTGEALSIFDSDERMSQ